MKEENKIFIYDRPIKVTPKYLLKIVVNFFRAAIYKFVLNIFVPKREYKPQYKVAICAIFKNEAKYLKEWIEFHKIVGVEHFYLYNNNSTDNYQTVLKKYIDDGIVTLIQWEKNQAQMEAYRDCVLNFANDTEWLGFIDIDEYVVPKKTDDIYSFLKGFSKNRPAVLIYWKIFGTSGFNERDTSRCVAEDFVSCWPKYVDIGKCFLNTKYHLDDSKKRNAGLHHRLYTKYGLIHFPPVNEFDKIVIGTRNVASSEFPIQINHYFTKSYSEYVEKMAKGDVFFKINPHDEEYFLYHEGKCSDVDYSAYKYLEKLKSSILDNKHAEQ